MGEPVSGPKGISLQLIEEKVAHIQKQLEKDDDLKGLDLKKIQKELELLSESLKGDLSSEVFTIDTQVSERVAKAIEQLIRSGQSAARRDGNLGLSLWKVLGDVRAEIQNLKKKVIVERAGKPELGGGASQK